MGGAVLKLGQVCGLGYDGKLLVKGKFAPKLRIKVFDNTKKGIGIVTRVFGPVKSPYISIKLPRDNKPSLDIIGKEVFVRKNS